MKIAIIVAMQKELALMHQLMEKYGSTQEIDHEFLTAYEGKVGSNDVILMQCGIGKVNAALRTYALIETYHPDIVVNSGVAGGLDESMGIGSVLVANGVAYHDVWCGPGTEYGAADGFPQILTPAVAAMDLMSAINAEQDCGWHFGLICSGDKFISTPDEVQEIKSHFPHGLACDMESAAIAQTCSMCGVPFMVVRVLSDRPGGGENISEYQNFWNEAPRLTFKAVASLVENLHK